MAVVPVQVGGVQLLIETKPGVVVGSEPTSGGRVARAAEAVVDAFDTAGAAIEAIAGKVAATVTSLGQRAVAPRELTVEFGLSFTASGGVIVAGVEAQAALRVTLTYPGPPAAAPSGQAL